MVWHFARKDLYHCLMPDYAWRYRTSTLIMAPINFWWNSDPFKKKNIFLAQKLTELEHFLQISKIFNSKSLKYGPKIFERVPWPSWMSLTMKLTHFNPHISFFHTYELNITFLWSRAQCAPPPWPIGLITLITFAQEEKQGASVTFIFD